eukprot:jgi/Tetstr1/465080/TSEL_009808.t1
MEGAQAVWLAVESFLPQLAGRRVLFHEENHAVCNVLAGLTSGPPEMVAELRRLRYLLDNNGIYVIKARYISGRPPTCGRLMDSDDCHLDPELFAELQAEWGTHSVDRFASALNAMPPRHNLAWLDLGCEAVDSLHHSDASGWGEKNNCNLPWPLLPDMGAR